MESWSYVPEEKGYLFPDEVDFSLDAFMRSTKSLVEWDNKPSCNFERDGFNSGREVVQSMEYVDLGFSDLLQKSYHGSQPLETSSCELDSNSSRRGNSSTHVVALDSSLGDEESESQHFSSLFESKTHDSSLIDLKLGRLADCTGASNEDVGERLTLTSRHPAALAKRARTSSLPAHAPVCQVFGCNKDLSSSKDYHKRHKVCDVHSKTAKVIVNGAEQRFCQQCSRFHLLAEFDDGKRSCRRRLAEHNERRRKPQFNYMNGNNKHKILQSYQGAKFVGSSLQNIPQFAFQDIFQSGILLSGKHDQIYHSEHVKLEEEFCSPLLAAPVTLDQELSSCVLSLLSAPSSQNPSRHLTGNPLIFQGVCKDDQVSATPLRINSKEVIKNGSTTPSDAGCTLQVQRDDICQPSESFNNKDCLSSEHGTSVDLFQLSSNLQRVEQQRNSVLVKWEMEDYCFPTV